MVCSVTSTEWNWRNAALCLLRKNIHLNLCIIGGHHGILCEEERERNPTAQMCEFPYFTPPGARVPVWAPCKVPKRRGFKNNHRVSTAPVFQPKLFLYRINPVGGQEPPPVVMAPSPLRRPSRPPTKPSCSLLKPSLRYSKTFQAQTTMFKTV